MILRLLLPSLLAASAMLTSCIDDTQAPAQGNANSKQEGGDPAKTPASKPTAADKKVAAKKSAAGDVPVTWIVYTYPG